MPDLTFWWVGFSADDLRPVAWPAEFPVWNTGEEGDRVTMCAMVRAETPEDAWAAVLRGWPEATERWAPGERPSESGVPRSNRFPMPDWWDADEWRFRGPTREVPNDDAPPGAGEVG